MARRKVIKPPVNETRSQSQTNKPCLICKQGGRTIGRMGDVELNYCGHHRKYGERVLNFLVNSVFQYKLGAFLNDTKRDLFMNNIPELCPEDYKKLADYVNSKIIALDEVRECYEKTK